MSLIFALLIGVGMGIVFGFALEKSRVFEPGMIVGQMQLRNYIMLKVFLTAVATGAVVLAVLNGFGYVKLGPKAALYSADIIGGLILGAGIALAGAWPGTTLAQVGARYRDALFTLVAAFSLQLHMAMRSRLSRRVSLLRAAARSFSPISSASPIGWARLCWPQLSSPFSWPWKHGSRGAARWARTSMVICHRRLRKRRGPCAPRLRNKGSIQ